MSDGAYAMLPPLAPETYDVNFGGSLTVSEAIGGGFFSLDITCHLTVAA